MEEQDAAYRESLEQDRIKEALEAEKRRQAEEEARVRAYRLSARTLQIAE